MFEAQCVSLWASKGSPPLKGPGPWSDFVAVNGACDKTSNTYMPATRGDRDLATLRQKQIHGALRTLESFCTEGERDLVEVPMKARDGHDDAAISLMQEAGASTLRRPLTTPSRQPCGIPSFPCRLSSSWEARSRSCSPPRSSPG